MAREQDEEDGWDGAFRGVEGGGYGEVVRRRRGGAGADAKGQYTDYAEAGVIICLVLHLLLI